MFAACHCGNADASGGSESLLRQQYVFIVSAFSSDVCARCVSICCMGKRDPQVKAGGIWIFCADAEILTDVFVLVSHIGPQRIQI